MYLLKVNCENEKETASNIGPSQEGVQQSFPFLSQEREQEREQGHSKGK